MQVCCHEGELTKQAVERASKGLVRRLVCMNGKEKTPPAVRDALLSVLHTTPCTLTELSLSGT